MRCKRIKGLIPDLLEGRLDDIIKRQVLIHLESCLACAKEKLLYEETWKLAGDLPEIEPQPGFKARVWNRIVRQEEPAAGRLNWLLRFPRWEVALATAAIIILVIGIAVPDYLRIGRQHGFILGKDEKRIILTGDVELLENLEVIEDIDFLENMKVIENLDKYKSDKV
ncbi:MAG: zf-HC2 domain-containing protein [Nitrospirota bacterium]|nr:zf-HC2 domain-containing protein [Nitrospirota bacterium]